MKNIPANNVRFLYGVILFLCFMPFVSPAIALSIGLLLALSGIKLPDTSRYTSISLQASIVLMGFGMHMNQVLQASKTGFVETAISVTLVMSIGFVLTRLFKVDAKIGLLIASGTAICGGSAIAAVSPVIDARSHQISFALVVVFVLNAIALIIFPMLGHYFHLSEELFGNWAAIAIHDTSSVVGAGATYGPHALEIATTVKLIRALWIIPLTLVLAFMQKGSQKGKIKIPWFIGLFALSMVFAYFLPQWQITYGHLHWLGQKGMVIALFLIGSQISITEIKKAGWQSFGMGLMLWLVVGVSSFFALRFTF
jgi:uncharacterized integral membrane protein (TIGR00698 family)